MYVYKKLIRFLIAGLALCLMFIALNMGLPIALNHGYTKTALQVEKVTSPLLIKGTYDDLTHTLKTTLLSGDQGLILQTLKEVDTYSSLKLKKRLFSLDNQKAMFTFYDDQNEIELFKELYDLIELDGTLALTTFAIDLLRQQAEVVYEIKGLNFDQHYYGTSYLTLHSPLPIHYQLDDGPSMVVDGPIVVQPDNTNLTYQTTNKYGQDSLEHSISLNNQPFDTLMGLRTPLRVDELNFTYDPKLVSAFLPTSNVAVFYFNHLYYVANGDYEWSYYESEETNLVLDYIVSEEQGLQYIEDLPSTEVATYKQNFDKMVQTLLYTDVFFLGQIDGSIESEFPDLLKVKTWGDYKKVIVDKVTKGFDESYMYHNLVAGYIKEAPDILYVRLYDKGTDYKEGLRLVFGNSYVNIYRFKEGQLQSDDPALTPEHYEETPLYSARLDEDPYGYRTQILKIASTFDLEQKTPEQLVSDVGDYIIKLITYDRQNVLQYDSHTPYKAIDGGLGVCESYATLAYDLLNQLGVTTYYIHADDDNREDDTHAYNLVKLEDQYFFYDFTWADKGTYIDRRYYGFELGFHPYKPYLSGIILEVFESP